MLCHQYLTILSLVVCLIEYSWCYWSTSSHLQVRLNWKNHFGWWRNAKANAAPIQRDVVMTKKSCQKGGNTHKPTESDYSVPWRSWKIQWNHTNQQNWKMTEPQSNKVSSSP
jgi:hypothetical protein